MVGPKSEYCQYAKLLDFFEMRNKAARCEQVTDCSRGKNGQGKLPTPAQGDQHGDGHDHEPHVLTNPEQYEAENCDGSIPVAVQGEDDPSDEWHGEGNFVKVKLHQALDRPPENISSGNRQGCPLAQPFPTEQVDGKDRRRYQHCQGNAEHARVVPEPVQRPQHGDYGVEMVSQDVVNQALDFAVWPHESRVLTDHLIENSQIIPGGPECAVAKERHRRINRHGEHCKNAHPTKFTPKRSTKNRPEPSPGTLRDNHRI